MSMTPITRATPTTPMHRGLKNRHIQMIALGSAIGTGLFLAAGAGVATAGPVVLVGFVIAGLVIFMMMRMLGEMAVDKPVSGSFGTYASDNIGRWAGFAIGWNWWYTCIVVSMLELTAAGVFVQFFIPTAPAWLVALIALVAITAVNLIHVGAFGEFEFWFSLIKVVAVVAMIVLGLVLIFGVGTGQPTGLSNLWDNGGFAPKGIGGFLLSLVAVTFTFGGIESIGTAAGEAKDPAKAIPKAFNAVLWRILVFYVGAIGVLLIIYPWDRIGIEESPFVAVLSGVGIVGGAIILNVVVLTAALSVFNVMTYSGARMLYGLAEKGQAPALFARINRRGVPVLGLLVNAAIIGVVVILNYLFPGQLILVLVAIILGNEIITWSAIVVSHLRFRARKNALGETTAYRSPFYPWANWICLAYFAMLIVIMIVNPDFRTGAIALPIWVAALLIGALLWTRSTRRRGHADSGLATVASDAAREATGTPPTRRP